MNSSISKVTDSLSQLEIMDFFIKKLRCNSIARWPQLFLLAESSLPLAETRTVQNLLHAQEILGKSERFYYVKDA